MHKGKNSVLGLSSPSSAHRAVGAQIRHLSPLEDFQPLLQDGALDAVCGLDALTASNLSHIVPSMSGKSFRTVSGSPAS